MASLPGRGGRTNVIPIGSTFGRWTVIGPPQFRPGYRVFYPCRCECGVEKVIRGDDLKCGQSISCGCLRLDALRAALVKHGEARSRLYRIRGLMIQRCTNPNNTGYAHYGGRGIAACPEWLASYEAFRDWAMANGYRDDLELDRRDNDGPYSPSNCRWITRSEQMRNTRQVRNLTAFGETKCLAEWARDPRCVVARKCLEHRLKVGWPPERAIVTPSDGSANRPRRSRVPPGILKALFPPDDFDREAWRPIPGRPGYEASDLGRVRSFLKVEHKGHGGRGRRVPLPTVIGDTPRLLKRYLHRGTHPVVTLYDGEGGSKDFAVSRLVLMAHVGPCPPGMEACHFPDPDPQNCRLGNLRWDTKSENGRDKARIGRLVLVLTSRPR